jgi:DNA recombination protein RmuC
MELTLLILVVLLLVVVIVMLLTFRKKEDSDVPQLLTKVNELQGVLQKIESNLKEDFRINREESSNMAKSNRDELNKAIAEFRNETGEVIRQLSKHNMEALEKLNTTLEHRVNALIDKTEKSVREFQEAFDKNVKSFNDLQREKFGQLETKQQELVLGTEKKLESIRVTVEEKLEKTLSERLGQSFETVGKQLIEVQKGLGEMQTIASDVGGLKKVLSNVKVRGGVGEVQLAMLLEQILAPTQYDANVKTKKGSNEQVEFAIKLPGKSEDEDNFVYLPIDAKFPKDTYEHLLTAYEHGGQEEIEAATKNLENTIKKMAKDIRDKYIDPPNTTDFAILFLPFESIYAEVIRRSDLVDQLRDSFKISVAGPTTLVAILNSLQMGFRTLALQKRSSEVWKVLGAVKTEFDKFWRAVRKSSKEYSNRLRSNRSCDGNKNQSH